MKPHLVSVSRTRCSVRNSQSARASHQDLIANPSRSPVDSHFLRAVHSFKMEIIPALERTLQGKAKPCTCCQCLDLIATNQGASVITKCSLAAVMASSQTNSNNPHYRPPHLPPPTEVPLRYCSHNEDNTPIDEADCLLSLLSPSPEGKSNKEHYILASADPVSPTEEKPGNDQRRQRDKPPQTPQVRYTLRRDARLIPGVPIIYVKRSVMILEPMSERSEAVRNGVERGKFKADVVTGKRKRGPEDDDGAPSVSASSDAKAAKKIKGPKGPNPLSVKKPKKREAGAVGSKPSTEKKEGAAVSTSASKGKTEGQGNEGEQTTKTRRKRRHKSSKAGGEVQPSAPAAVES